MNTTSPVKNEPGEYKNRLRDKLLDLFSTINSGLRGKMKDSIKDLQVETSKFQGVKKSQENEYVKLQAPIPPKFGEFVAYLLPKKHRGPLLGDLQELYPVMVEKFGTFWAKVWYWAQVINAVVVLLCKWGIIGAAVEVVRRFIK